MDYSNIPKMANLRTIIVTAEGKTMYIENFDNTKGTAIPSPEKANYKYIGCYRYREEPVFQEWTFRGYTGQLPDASDYGYDNTDYYKKENRICECAKFAKSKGFPVFALHNDGRCLTSPDAYRNYSRYGKTIGCPYDGKGGVNIMDVYGFK
jgi:hypothetical protein